MGQKRDNLPFGPMTFRRRRSASDPKLVPIGIIGHPRASKVKCVGPLLKLITGLLDDSGTPNKPVPASVARCRLHCFERSSRRLSVWGDGRLVLPFVSGHT